jgi:hypothetical protein
VPEEEAGFCDGCHGTVTKSHIQWFSNFDFASCLAQNIRPKQLRQLGDIRRDPSRLILAEQLGRGASARIVVLFDHLVGSREQRRWHFEAERLCGLEING